jgi:hypothetical protein
MASRNMAGRRIGATASVLLSLALLSSAIAPVARAERAGGRILTDLTIGGSDACVEVRVTFALPVHAIKHFPETYGDEVRVQVGPAQATGSDVEALSQREAIRAAEFDDRVPLDEVFYEGDIAGGPFLTFRFTRPVTFHVDQGDDFRSLVLYLPGPPAEGPCPPGGATR